MITLREELEEGCDLLHYSIVETVGCALVLMYGARSFLNPTRSQLNGPVVAIGEDSSAPLRTQSSLYIHDHIAGGVGGGMRLITLLDSGNCGMCTCLNVWGPVFS